MVQNMTQIKHVPYEYHNLQIPGGGFVTGFAFHPTEKGLLYIRTDIGGCYRFNPEKNEWISLVNHVTHFDRSETFPLAIALDPKDPDILYVACGLGRPTCGIFPNGYFMVSFDRGEHFEKVSDLPCHVHGNAVGRGTGMRLVVDPSDSDRIYFASQEGGLLVSYDRGKTWEMLPVGPEDGNTELDMAFVWVAPDGNTIVASAAGTSNYDEASAARGHSLYISHDKGKSFKKLPQPEPKVTDNVKIYGYVGARCAFDGKYFYVTMNETGKYAYIPGYCSECGDVKEGRIVRYAVDENYNFGSMEDITPFLPTRGMTDDENPMGFGGIDVTGNVPGFVIAGSICHPEDDVIVVSKDYGKTWEINLLDMEVGNMHFNASYMKPEYNGGRSFIHWMTDIKIDPFSPDTAWFNTGSGVFRSEKLQSPDCSWSDCCKGIEETVHLNVYAPPKGDIIALDAVGDLGGFVFTQVDEPCENSFADEAGNRYITSINCDYPDEIPNVFVATPRGNWRGKTKGGIVYSEDAGKTLRHCAQPRGISEKIDKLIDWIEMPNINSGWITISPDSHGLVWSVADGELLPADAVVYSKDKGETWAKSEIIPLPGAPEPKVLKAFYDRVSNGYVFGFGEKGRLYVSSDGGATFVEKEIPLGFPEMDLAGIDAGLDVEIKGIAGEDCKFILAMNTEGLHMLTYDIDQDIFVDTKLSREGDSIFCVGLGIGEGESEYINSKRKAIYVCAIIDGVYGFFRSFDFGTTYEKINDESQMFGEIKSIDGDKRKFGRFFIATGTVGLKYGEMTV